jgi:hypothetical protein
MRHNSYLPLAGITMALMLAGCAGGMGTGLTTSSVTPQAKVAAKPAVDPSCVALSSQIQSVRQEGTPARVQAVSSGKTKMVSIKRTSLAKVAELDRLNSEFQMKCSKYPSLQTAAAPAAPTTARVAVPTVAAPTVATPAAATAARRTAAATAPRATIAQPVTTPIVSVPKQ